LSTPKKNKMTFTIILLLVLVGLAAGFLSGLVGIGGGVIIVPALVILLGFSQNWRRELRWVFCCCRLGFWA
jgi:uncharacterized membrane protein